MKMYFDLFLTLSLLISGLQSRAIKCHLYALNFQYFGALICHKCVVDTLVHLLYLEVSSVTVAQEGLVKDIVITVGSLKKKLKSKCLLSNKSLAHAFLIQLETKRDGLLHDGL